MAKAKIYKTDGTEDFDAESKELDDASAPGLLSDSAASSSTPSASAATSSASTSDTTAASATSSASTEPAPAEAPKEPEPFGDLHGEVSELTDVLEGDAISALKDAGNKVTPAVAKLQGIESKLDKLGDEVKARFTHAKTQLVNAMGALEMLFKRGK